MWKKFYDAIFNEIVEHFNELLGGGLWGFKVANFHIFLYKIKKLKKFLQFLLKFNSSIKIPLNCKSL